MLDMQATAEKRKDELVSYVLLWTLSHGRDSSSRPAKTYLQQLCADTGWCLQDLPGAIDDRDRWRERESMISVLVVQLDGDDDDDVKVKIDKTQQNSKCWFCGWW